MPTLTKRATTFCRTALFFLLLATLPSGPVAAGEKVDLGKAIKVGTGKTMVIQFTDPDCPFCRKAAAYFRSRRDVTLYIFLNPLAMHPHAREKSQYILSAQDSAKAYEDVMEGKLDDRQPAGISQAGVRLLEEHMAIAREEKIVGVPIFIISGRIVEGFDLPRIEELLPR